MAQTTGGQPGTVNWGSDILNGIGLGAFNMLFSSPSFSTQQVGGPATGNLATDWGNFWNGLIGAPTTAIGTGITNITGSTNAMGGGIKAGLGDIGSGAQSALTSVGAGGGAALANLGAGAGQGLNLTLSGLGSGVGQGAQAGLTGTGTGLTSLVSGLMPLILLGAFVFIIAKVL